MIIFPEMLRFHFKLYFLLITWLLPDGASFIEKGLLQKSYQRRVILKKLIQKRYLKEFSEKSHGQIKSFIWESVTCILIGTRTTKC